MSRPTDEELRAQFPELNRAKIYRPVHVKAPPGPLSAEQLAQFIWRVEDAAARLGSREFLIVQVPVEDVERVRSRLSPRALKSSQRGRSTWIVPIRRYFVVETKDGRTGRIVDTGST